MLSRDTASDSARTGSATKIARPRLTKSARSVEVGWVSSTSSERNSDADAA